MTKEELEKAVRQEQIIKRRYPEFYKFFLTLMDLQRGINAPPMPTSFDRVREWLRR